MNTENETIIQKLKSRKFWLSYGIAALILFAQKLGIDLTPQQIAGLVAIATGYNIGQGIEDAAKRKASAKFEVEHEKIAQLADLAAKAVDIPKPEMPKATYYSTKLDRYVEMGDPEWDPDEYEKVTGQKAPV